MTNIVPPDDPIAAFVEAACVPLNASRCSGTLDRAEAIGAVHSHIANTSIHAAAILGDDGTVRRWLALDPTSARNASATIASLVTQSHGLVGRVVADGGTLLAAFAGVEIVDGVQRLLDVGVDVAAPYTEGDSYFGIARNSLAIHVAAWRTSHRSLKCLIARGSPIDVPDGDGRTPLALAVRACVDSHWMGRRSPESVDALLRAGASPRGVTFPSGYADIDTLLNERDP